MRIGIIAETAKFVLVDGDGVLGVLLGGHEAVFERLELALEVVDAQGGSLLVALAAPDGFREAGAQQAVGVELVADVGGEGGDAVGGGAQLGGQGGGFAGVEGRGVVQGGGLFLRVVALGFGGGHGS